MKELMKNLTPPPNPLPESFKLPSDWEYRDINWVTSEIFNKFLEKIGEANLHCIVRSKTNAKDGTAIERGQYFISPLGLWLSKKWLGELK